MNLKKNCDIFNDFKIELFTIKKKLYKYKYNKLKKESKMEVEDIKNVTTDYNSFRNSFYQILTDKFNQNPTSVDFMNKIETNEQIHQKLDEIKDLEGNKKCQ